MRVAEQGVTGVRSIAQEGALPASATRVIDGLPDPGIGGSEGAEPARTVAVIVPSWSGRVAELEASLRRQTYTDYTITVVRGVNPAGLARNLGAAATRSEFLLFVDDDATLGCPDVIETLVRILRSDPGIAVAGPSKLIPPGATWFQRWVAMEVPRWVFPLVEEDLESNPPLDYYGYTGVTTTCCLMRRSVFEAVGGFDEQLQTGQDTEFFFRVRKAGYRFVVPRQCWVYHPPPGHLGMLLRKSFRSGMGHAQEALRAPERRMAVVPLDRWQGRLLLALSPLLFVPSLFISRYFDPEPAWRFGFRPLKALSTYATLYGYSWAWFREARKGKRRAEAAKVARADG